MSAIFRSSSDHRHSAAPATTTTKTFIHITALSLLSFSFFFLFRHFTFEATITTPTRTISDSNTNTGTILSPLPRPRHPSVVVDRTGIVDHTGAMTEDFLVGKVEESLMQSVIVNVTDHDNNEKLEVYKKTVFRVEKFRVCDSSMINYIPCFDMERISRSNSSEKVEKYDRHCPEEGKLLDCFVPRPKNYKLHIPWPKSREVVWYDNIPHKNLLEDKGGQTLISRNGDKFIFPDDRTQFIPGAKEYLDQISKMAPEIALGKSTRVALDLGCGIASFGAYLMERNVTSLSIAPNDIHSNHIQFTLERGVPAIVAPLAAHRLPYPSQAFDLIHCSSCRINWNRDDGLLLLEINRILRGGGYFVWAAEPVYKHEENLLEQWREMEDLTGRICWELVEKEGYIAIWQKPLNNSCYLSRDSGVQPSLCDTDNNPDHVWHVNMEPCITYLPDSINRANVTSWPARLHYPPGGLYGLDMDADKSRKEIYKADSNYWFAAALLDHNVDCWVMNVVPVSGPNTLALIYDRGLVGVMHDWCEPFDTYPRTYDLLNAVSLFSTEVKRRNITNIMLEMDRMLRPGGWAYIRDTVSVIYQLQKIARAIGWVTFMFDSDEVPYSSWKLLTCEKRL